MRKSEKGASRARPLADPCALCLLGFRERTARRTAAHIERRGGGGKAIVRKWYLRPGWVTDGPRMSIANLSIRGMLSPEILGLLNAGNPVA